MNCCFQPFSIVFHMLPVLEGKRIIIFLPLSLASLMLFACLVSRCLWSGPITNRASLIRIVAVCIQPFLVAQNCKKISKTAFFILRLYNTKLYICYPLVLLFQYRDSQLQVISELPYLFILIWNQIFVSVKQLTVSNKFSKNIIHLNPKKTILAEENHA